MWRNARRVGVICGVAGLLSLGLTGTGSAHVTLSTEEAPAGAHARVDVRVPNESDEASTVKVELTLPEDYPLVSVSTKDVPGWTAKTEKRTLDEPVNAYGRDFDEVVSTVTWTADSDKTGIGVGEFGEFGLSLGPMPEEVGATLVFKVIQTYSDGEESPWIEAPEAGQPEPEHPAPVLTVVAADSGDTVVATDTDAGDASDTTNPDADGRTLPVVLSIVALVLAGLALARTRRPAARTGGTSEDGPATTK